MVCLTRTVQPGRALDVRHAPVSQSLSIPTHLVASAQQARAPGQYTRAAAKLAYNIVTQVYSLTQKFYMQRLYMRIAVLHILDWQQPAHAP